MRILCHGLSRNAAFAPSADDNLASESMSIVVPIHDAPEVTQRCLGSLQRYARRSDIILVDDASRLARTSEVIRDYAQRNGWKTKSHDDARGHSAACNVGAKLASRPYLCLLNSDTVVTPGCWRAIERSFENDGRIGAAGPSTSVASTAQALPLAEHCRLYWNDSQICAFAQRMMQQTGEGVVSDLPWISGFALFLRRRVWEELDGFDMNLPDYGNEVELCKRLKNLQYRVVWVRNSYIHHIGRQTYESSIGAEEILARSEAAKQYIKQKHSEQS
jgi:GT2 family glycosyltransferase